MLKERFEAYGDGTHQEKTAQPLDAECNKRLERHLHTSGELLFDAKIDILILHQEILHQEKAELETQLQAVIAELFHRKTGLQPAHIPIPDDYNEGRLHSEQWSTTSTVVQKLSGSNANRVKDYLARHPKVERQLEQYNQDYGYQ